MDRAWFSRLLLVIGVCALGAYALYPSYHYYAEAPSEEGWKDNKAFCDSLPTWASCKKFNLGLDLQGGVHLVMGVEVEKAVQQKTNRYAENLRDALKDEGIGFTDIALPRNSYVIKAEVPEASHSAFESYVRSKFSVLNIEGRDGNVYSLKLLESEAQLTRDNAVEQTIKTIRNRADKIGVAEPTIARRGEENVLIQLPGVKDPESAIDIIGRTAQLEFRMIDTSVSSAFAGVTGLPPEVERRSAGSEIYFELPKDMKEQVRAVLEPLVPSDKALMFGVTFVGDGRTVREGYLRTHTLEGQAGITGDYLVNAEARPDPTFPARWNVNFEFDPKGAKIFGELTEKNIGNPMAVVLDELVESVATIQSKITSSGRITLNSSGSPQKAQADAQSLSLVLRAGALPAPVEIREQRQVGKTLGEQSVEDGEMAILIGALLVVLFMLVYYRASGVIANLALVLNVFLVMAVLASLEATLTLPGMAGIVLTIGMAVDANVIIFERIREELRIGKTPRAAIDSGYSRAFSTILDANVTTIIAAVVLFEYGSGPVRGFAVTLFWGILCSMFTAIVVTRLIFDFFSSRRRLQSLSI